MCILYTGETTKAPTYHISNKKNAVPMQFPKAGQWWSNPLIFVLQLVQYLTLGNSEEFCTNNKTSVKEGWKKRGRMLKLVQAANSQ